MSDDQDYERLSRAAYSQNASAEDMHDLARFLRERDEGPASAVESERPDVVPSGVEADEDIDPPRRVGRRALIGAVAVVSALAVLACGVFIGRASNHNSQALTARPRVEVVGGPSSLAVFDSLVTQPLETSGLDSLFDESQTPAIKRLLYEDYAVRLIAARGHPAGMPDGEQICLIMVPQSSGDDFGASCLPEDEFKTSGLVTPGATGAVLYKWGPTGGPVELLCGPGLLQC